MAETISIVALLWFEPNQQAEVEAYESRAFAIISRYGGRLERRLQCLTRGPTSPEELHIITFPDQTALERYRADSELETLAELRARVIHETVVWEVWELPKF